MDCQLPKAISKIEEILSKNGEGIASAMLSGIQINMLNEAKNNLQSAIEIRMARTKSTTTGSESKKKINERIEKGISEIKNQYINDKMFVLPENITELKDNQVFVFGANAEGIHGKGSALQARKFGTLNGEAINTFSKDGNTWGIVTKESPNGSKVSFRTLSKNIDKLINYANDDKYSDKEFLFTAVGTGLAGFREEDILEILQNVEYYENIKFPAKWKKAYYQAMLDDINITDEGDVYDTEATLDDNTSNISNKKTIGSESKKSIHHSLSGKVILANSGIGKSYAKRIYNNIVDGDDLFRDAANFILEKYNQSKYKIDSVSNMRDVFELWGEYSSDIDKVTEAKKRRDEVYRKYAELAKESSKNGMTVLSSSAREPIISIADFAIVQNDAETIAKNRSSELRENKEEFSIEKAKEKIEAFKTKVSGIKTINLGKDQYISEILEKGVTTPGSESVDSTKKDFRSEFKNKRPSAAKWVDKEVAKFDVATQAISDGTNNSTAGFVKDFYGDNANTGTYTKDDVVYLSTNGNRTGRVVPVKNGVLQGSYKNIDKAIEAGAKFVADTSKHLASTGKYNVGEVELAEYLQSKGYVREDKAGYGLWSPSKASTQTTKVSKPITADELKIEKALSSDIDAVETSEDATKEWLSKRIDTLGLPEEVVESMKNNMNRLNGLLYNGTKERSSEIDKKHDKLNQLLLNKLLTDEEKYLVEAMDELHTLNGKLEAAVMAYKVDTSYRDMIIKYLNLIKDVYGYPEALKLKPFLKDSATFIKNSDYLNGYASYNNKAFQNQFKYKEFLFKERGHLTYVISDIANVLDQSFIKSFTQLKKTDYDEQAKFLNLFINTINYAYNNNDNLISSQFAEENSQSYNPQSEPDVVDNKYKTISKDDIEAAKDIMSNNKKECE